MQKEKNIQQKSQRRINDIVTSIAVMSTLIESERVSFNNYPIDGKLRRDAMSYEMDQLIKKLALLTSKFKNMPKTLIGLRLVPNKWNLTTLCRQQCKIFYWSKKMIITAIKGLLEFLIFIASAGLVMVMSDLVRTVIKDLKKGFKR